MMSMGVAPAGPYLLSDRRKAPDVGHARLKNLAKSSPQRRIGEAAPGKWFLQGLN